MSAVNAVYGFLADCAAMYDKRIYDMFDEAFRWLPLATLVDDVTMVRNNRHETTETTETTGTIATAETTTQTTAIAETTETVETT